MGQIISTPTKTRTIREQVERHPFGAFVGLTFAISWTFFLLMGLIDMGAVNGFGIIAATGPALAAMIVSGMLHPEPSGARVGLCWRLSGILWFFVLAILVFRRFWLAAGLTSVLGRDATAAIYPSFPAFLLDSLGAAVIAVVLSGIHSSRQGEHHLLRSLNPRGIGVGWYWMVIAVLLYPSILWIGNCISAQVGLPVAAQRATGLWYWLAVDGLLMFLYVLLCGGGLEEPGWRGFALPMLQKRHSPLQSSLFLAVIWAFWHLPLFWLGSYGGGPMGVFSFLVGVAPVAILFTAVFNLTGGSLPIVMLLHTAINTTPLFVQPTMLASGLWMLFLFAVALGIWRSPQTF